ncbi:MAG: CrcB family protein [Nocardioidaceae bacterium]
MSSLRTLRPSTVGVVALGGALGAVARYLLSTAFPDPSGRFPWAIFAVNVTGGALLAFLPSLGVVRRRPLLAPFLGTGVLGGYTTLSTYGEQSRALAAAGRTGLAAAYVVGTLAACLIAVVLADRFGSLGERTRFGVDEGDL